VNQINIGRASLLGAAALAALAFSGAPAFASVTVGAANGGNCYPFSCGPTDGVTEYQEAYNQNAFAGVQTFNTVSFSKFTAFVPGASMDTGTYAVSFYLSTEPVGSLSSNLSTNEGAFLGSLGTFTLSGPMPSVLSLTGSTISYDPSQGDLLMDVGISNGTSFSGAYNEFFNADTTGTEVSRAWVSTIDGSFGDTTGALQTTFSMGVPEPATWAMMLFGVGAIGASLRSSRRNQLAAVQAA
jgi:hypothetical protein